MTVNKMKSSAAFMSTPRTFHWSSDLQTTAPQVELSGKLTRYNTEKSNWMGLNLTARKEVDVPPAKNDQRWKEYSEARRTVEPDYPVPERDCRPRGKASYSNLSDLIAQKPAVGELGNSKKR
jgi:hypothetical protein